MKLNIQKTMLFICTATAFFYGCSLRTAVNRDLTGGVDLDTVRSSLLDMGKMWTFDFPPLKYFSDTYGFTPGREWLDKARLSTLRLPNCTASFISEDGLVMTNHHCARTALDSVNREGERLAEQGFYAATLDEERKVGYIYIDQLIVINDVTGEVLSAFNSGKTESDKYSNRIGKINEIQKRYTDSCKIAAPGDSMVFNVISFYNGGRYSVYGYKRYTDVRLVYAPEDAAAFFGGDPDNFTYPRYDFDCAFFRVYENGKPLRTQNFFRLSPEGAKEGDAVFVIGNPGSTRRLYTVVQLEHMRDLEYPIRLQMLNSVGDVYLSYVKAHPDERINYLNTIFSLENSKKAIGGYLNGLRDPVLMAKKKDFELKFRKAFADNSAFSDRYGNPWKDITYFQKIRSKIYPRLDAFNFKGKFFSKYLTLTSRLADLALQGGSSIPDSVKADFYPKDFNSRLETQLLAVRLAVMVKTFKGENKEFNSLLRGRSPGQAAEELSYVSIVATEHRADSVLSLPTAEILKSSDPLLRFILACRAEIDALQREYSEAGRNMQVRLQVLGNALYDIYGTQISPDATFTLRISDGVMKGYDYNGTIAPAMTTFYGMYDRYYSFGGKDPWNLPARWLSPPDSFRMNTPMNFVSTNDIIGGNSGSPAVNKDLQVVGLIFDGNIESLPGNIIFDETMNRTVSVHSSAIFEALEKIYRADRLVKELKNGKITP
jgi:hypothetical protein